MQRQGHKFSPVFVCIIRAFSLSGVWVHLVRPDLNTFLDIKIKCAVRFINLWPAHFIFLSDLFIFWRTKNFADSHNLRKDLSPKNNSFYVKIYSFYVNHYTFNNVICQLPKKHSIFFMQILLIYSSSGSIKGQENGQILDYVALQ